MTSKDVIHSVVDDGYFFEVQEHYAKNIVVGFARLDGRPVGIVANQPAFLAGTLDINASVKGARFVRFCDASTFRWSRSRMCRDFCRGRSRSTAGLSSMGRSCCYAFAEATVPK
jgi:propionyl-CoA carboxylase beta chain